MSEPEPHHRIAGQGGSYLASLLTKNAYQVQGLIPSLIRAELARSVRIPTNQPSIDSAAR